MTLIFIGHDFKYEIEAVCKLFFPVRTFSFVYPDGDAAPASTDDSILLSRKVTEEHAELSVNAKLNGSAAFRRDTVSLDAPDYEHSCEFTLCRMLFECLRELSGIIPEWGMLTGVRPVKLITRLKNSGMTEPEIFDYMRDRHYVSHDKVRLACDTASSQEKVIAELPKNSVSLYVSIPFCPSRCAYCSFVSQTVGSFYKLIPEYTDRLCEELVRTSMILKNLDLRLDTVYFGGGTPTSLEADVLERIMRTVAENFDLSHIREYTVEAGRPDTVTIEKLQVIKDNGGDRVSVNPQTMRQSVLDAIGRKHTVEQFLDAYQLAKSVGFKAVNVDLIAGLPTDDFKGFRSTLESVISLDPENITVHALSIKRAADLMHQEELELNAAETSRMIAFSNESLTAAVYSPYYLYRQKNQLGNQENVGWEKGGTVGIYNVNMMEEIQTVLAVGAGGSTKIVAGERNIKRLYDPKYPFEYLKHFEDTVLPRKDEAERMIADILNSGGKINI